MYCAVNILTPGRRNADSAAISPNSRGLAILRTPVSCFGNKTYSRRQAFFTRVVIFFSLYFWYFLSIWGDMGGYLLAAACVNFQGGYNFVLIPIQMRSPSDAWDKGIFRNYRYSPKSKFVVGARFSRPLCS